MSLCAFVLPMCSEAADSDELAARMERERRVEDGRSSQLIKK